MASRRDEKAARREQRMQGTEGAVRRTTQALVAAARNAGHTPSRIRQDLLRGVKDVLGLGTLETSDVVIDSRTLGLIDYTGAFRQVCDRERIELLDPAARQRWLSVVEDELEDALRRRT